MADGDHYQADPDALYTEFPDGTGVLLHLRTKLYFALNATGACVWKALAEGQAHSAPALARHLSERFEVGAEAAQRDVEAWLAGMLAEGLVRRS